MIFETSVKGSTTYVICDLVAWFAQVCLYLLSQENYLNKLDLQLRTGATGASGFCMWTVPSTFNTIQILCRVVCLVVVLSRRAQNIFFFVDNCSFWIFHNSASPSIITSNLPEHSHVTRRRCFTMDQSSSDGGQYASNSYMPFWLTQASRAGKFRPVGIRPGNNNNSRLSRYSAAWPYCRG